MSAPHSLMPLLVDPVRLKRAARSCMRSGGAPGADGVSWKTYRVGLDARVDGLARRLAAGAWMPSPVRRVEVTTVTKVVPIVIPSVEDRVVHRALRSCLEPILDEFAYPEWMFGWRPRKGRVPALAYASRYSDAAARTWVADIDVAAVTGGGSVAETVGWVAEWVHDGSFLAVLRRALEVLPAPLAPGSGLTPLLTNLRLLPVDAQLADLRAVRVTDNYAVFCSGQVEAEEAFSRIVAAVESVGLRANATKSKVWSPNLEDLFLAG